MEERSRGSFGFAMAWMMALTIPFCLVPIVGPFLAGVVGGRRARTPGLALGAAVLPLLFLVGILTAQSHQGVKVAGNDVYLPAGFTLIQALSLLAGALTGSSGRVPKLAGLVLMIIGLYLFQAGARPYLNTLRLLLTPRAATPAEANATCPDRLKRLYNAVMQYAEAWDDTLPPSDRWMTALTDPTQKFADDSLVHCPAVSPGNTPRYGYAMNAALGGKRLKEIKDAASMPLFYDSSDLEANTHDNVTSLPVPGRHNGRNNVVYMDGHVAQR